MKNLVLATLLNIFLYSTLFAQMGELFTLNGFISGKETGKMYLRYSYKYKSFIDSAIIKNGYFSFKGLINEPVKAELSDNKKLFTENYENYVPSFYIERGEMTISLSNKLFSNAKLVGSKTNDDYQIFCNELNPVLQNTYRLQDRICKEKSVLFTDSLIQCNNKAKQISINFIKNNSNSYIAVNAIQQLSAFDEIGPDSCLVFLNSLHSKIKNYHLTKKIKESLIAQSTSTVGHLSQDFTRNDVNGVIVNLSSFKGKYVLLDFWASWCIPCRELTPHLKELYKNYSSKGLEVIAISCDSKYEDWYKAIKTDSIGSFINVLSFTDKDMDFLKTHDNRLEASFEGELRKQFNLMPIPVQILIDKNGRIIGRYGATEKQSLEMLDDTLIEIFDGVKNLLSSKSF